MKRCIVAVFLIALVCCFNWQCTSTDQSSSADTTYASLNPNTKYVGMETCKGCHVEEHKHFIHTGMGKSLDTASMNKSSALFENISPVYDAYKDLYYLPLWKNNNFYVKEFRLNGKDTVHQRTECVRYIVGSGQHTNSHIWESNGYLFQAPLTFYTQKKQWDLPPGFENGDNSRFNRKIGLECMSCHNAFSGFEQGAENKFSFVKNGIDCERCHGPGSKHVEEKSKGILIDTSIAIDYSIVNPAKLPIDLQFDVCQRCHIQGNAVLKQGKSFYDFVPGMKLSDVMDVYMPVYSKSDDEHIMASHAERLKLSKCFIETSKSIANKSSHTKLLRPYKEGLTCITCHNPHYGVTQTDKSLYNKQCLNCHSSPDKTCKKSMHLQNGSNDNCVSCHMPMNNALDIPHVSVHDHKIAIHKNANIKEQGSEIKSLKTIVAINNSKPDDYSRAQAFINYNEKFNMGAYVLDSAFYLLKRLSQNDIRTKLMYIHIHFLRSDYLGVLSIVNADNKLASQIQIKQYDNYYAWMNYRIGESFLKSGDTKKSLIWFKQAFELSPMNEEFINKYANALAAENRNQEAEPLFRMLIKDHPQFAIGWNNYGYFELSVKRNIFNATNYFEKAILLDPDYVAAMMNLAGVYIYQNEIKKAKELLNRIIKIEPQNSIAKKMLKELN